MARVLCQDCLYPLITCVCEHLTHIKHKTQLVILQHPSEIKSAKNTVKLLKLISNNIEIHVGETEDDFVDIKASLLTDPSKCALLFPSESASTVKQINDLNQSINTLIVIDGTWRKAKKMLILNPWLLQFTQLRLTENIKANYQIRKTSVANGLSTIEAVAYALGELEHIGISPFFCALDGLKQSFTKRMPSSVKNRYPLDGDNNDNN